MRHEHTATVQQQLPLDADPASEASLHDAFDRSGLAKQRWTFERALRVPIIKRCLANIAEASIRARAEKVSPERGKAASPECVEMARRA